MKRAMIGCIRHSTLSTEGSSVKSTRTRGGSDMDEEYSKEIAGYILSIFRTNPFVVMSWGINPASITIVDVGVKFHVQGFKHKGFLQVVLNEGEDLFEVTLISEEGETVNRIEHIFVDNLISIIDDAVEKTEDYEKRISQEYGIITETEK
jgi:hypothetical protein